MTVDDIRACHDLNVLYHEQARLEELLRAIALRIAFMEGYNDQRAAEARKVPNAFTTYQARGNREDLA